MKRRICIRVLVFFLLSSLVISGCTQNLPAPNPRGDSSSGGISSGNAITEGNDRFALELYSNLANDPANKDQNLFFSPWSISSAMAVSYEGARNMTANEIRNVLHFSDDRDSLREGYSDFTSQYNKIDAAYEFRTANALWIEKTYPILPAFSFNAIQYYQAHSQNLGFIEDPEGSRSRINDWIANQTDDKITNVIGQGVITPDTKLIITNAVYFKGIWVKEFEKIKTSQQAFRLSSGDTVPVMMMARNDTESLFRYGEKDNIQILEMPYRNDTGRPLSMLILLPREGNLTRLDNTLDINNLGDLKKTLKSQLVMVYLPEFRLNNGCQLSSTLQQMGMPTAFSPSADFSGIDGTQNLGIDNIIHRAYIDVNEEGTEAAGTTFVYYTLKGDHQNLHPPEFHADHPFIFIIQDSENGNILFMGRVLNPNEG